MKCRSLFVIATVLALIGTVIERVHSYPNGPLWYVTDVGPFCAGCHAFAGVQMDCFTCHTPVPNDGPAVRGAADTDGDTARLSGVTR